MFKFSLLNADYEKVLERFVHILTKPVFPNDAFVKVKNIIIDSIVRSNDNPTDVGVRILKSNIYQNHPFSWTFDQAMKEVKHLAMVDLIKFHKKYITPENMILTIVGDFDLDEMEKIIKGIFSVWSEGSGVRIHVPKPTFEPKKVIKLPMLRDQVVLLLGQPSSVDIYHSDLISLKLLNYIAFHSLGSRIYQLREHSGLFYTAFGSWAAGVGKEPGFDYMGAILNPENVDHAEKKMRELVGVLAQHGITEEELVAARQLYLKSLIDAVSNNSSIANLIGTLEAFELGFDYYDDVLKQVQGFSVQNINDICKKYFVADDMISVRVGRV